MTDSELYDLYKCIISLGQDVTGRKVTSLQLEDADLKRKIEVLMELFNRDHQEWKANVDVFWCENKEHMEQWIKIQKDEYIDEFIKLEKDKFWRKKNN